MKGKFLLTVKALERTLIGATPPPTLYQETLEFCQWPGKTMEADISEYSAPLATDRWLMKLGNAAAFCHPDGIPRILMTRTGLLQEWLQTMGTTPGEQYMA